jgi:mannose-6-phosphate isomerase-like protein (cupin superfamily)
MPERDHRWRGKERPFPSRNWLRTTSTVTRSGRPRAGERGGRAASPGERTIAGLCTGISNGGIAGVKSIQTRRHRRRSFAVLHATRTSQAAMMTLAPGAESSESSSNEHAWAEQWLYVVSGTGSARIGRRTVPLREGVLVLIERREPHVIRAGRSRLVTMNVYVPPAYDAEGEPLRRKAGKTSR